MGEWKVQTLGDVCTLQRGFDLPTQDRRVGAFPLIGSSGVIDSHDQRGVRGPGVVTGRSGSIGNVFFIEDDFWPLNTTLFVKHFHGNDPRFVHYLLIAVDLKAYAGGTGVPTLNRNDVHVVPVKVPADVKEQHRIVALLDEAFEGVATAKANAEKNLQSARELLGRISGVFLDEAISRSRIAKLEELVEHDCTLSYGIVQPGDEQANGLLIVRPVDLDCSVVGSVGLKRIDPSLAKSYGRTTLKGGDILLCVRGTTGKLALADRELAGANVTRGIVPIRFDSAQLSQDFGYCLMRSEPVQMQIREKTYGTALMQINIRDLRRLTLPIPSPQEQEAMVERLGNVEAATDQLVLACERKLAALEELKKSLLHQAFSGQLTSATRTSIALPQLLETTSPQFSANVIALAFVRHEKQKREMTFGRVKEQKVLHLVEAVGGIQLGRQPFKDAAGPNDFAHMLKAEQWAKENHFFEMVGHEKRYSFRKLKNFDALLTDARKSLAPVMHTIERVVDHLVPMDKEEAEVFTTVLAAWNNLLSDGAEVTDIEIVLAARDRWHADKLAIPKVKFQDAIELIRRKGLVPNGTAKYVGGQSSLL
jgi:type I restriction enzyme, S subunit